MHTRHSIKKIFSLSFPYFTCACVCVGKFLPFRLLVLCSFFVFFLCESNGSRNTLRPNKTCTMFDYIRVDSVVIRSLICMVRHADRSMFDFENVQPFASVLWHRVICTAVLHRVHKHQTRTWHDTRASLFLVRMIDDGWRFTVLMKV